MKEYAPFYYTFLEKACEIRYTAILNLKKAISVLGFEPGLHRQNAIATPLAPPQLPAKNVHCTRQVCFATSWTDRHPLFNENY